jgi:hypothetical protein
MIGMSSVGSGAPPEASRGTHVVPVSKRLVALAGAVAIGLVLQHVLRRHLTTLQALSAIDPFGARARFAAELRFGGLGLFALTTVVGVSVISTSLRGFRLAHFPPPGMWASGHDRPVIGPAARRVACAGLVLGLLLVACSIAGAAVTWQMAERLLACRASSVHQP